MPQEPRLFFLVLDIEIGLHQHARRPAERVGEDRQVWHQDLDHEAPTGQQVIEGCSPRGYLIVQGQHVSDRSARNQDEIEVPV